MVLARIRAAGPLVWNERGYWMTASDRICRQILNHPDMLGQEGMIASFFGEDAFISIDERKLHNALRDVRVSAFGHGGVEKLVSVVRRIAASALDRSWVMPARTPDEAG